jgi:hypothetical protein
MRIVEALSAAHADVRTALPKPFATVVPQQPSQEVAPFTTQDTMKIA